MTDTRKAMQQALEALEETRNALAWFYDSYPADVTPKGNKLLPHVETVLTALREALAQQGEQPDVLAEYTRTDGHRQWESVGAWLYPGDKIAVISAGAAPAAQPCETCKRGLKAGVCTCNGIGADK